MWTIEDLVAVFDGSAIKDAEARKMQTEDAYEATICILQKIDSTRRGDPVRAKKNQIIRDSLALHDELSIALHQANTDLLATQQRMRDVHTVQEQLVRLYMQVIAGVNIRPEDVAAELPNDLVSAAMKANYGGARRVSRRMKAYPIVQNFNEARRRLDRRTLCELATEGVRDFPNMTRVRGILSAERTRRASVDEGDGLVAEPTVAGSTDGGSAESSSPHVEALSMRK
ncbi:hypothetical protein Slin15195_G127450 [Septoria linicola]|uniref:Uncharacterized protein n=1 Tax=Septoria linicola TaxID=215465 RepID=A0A9Q9BAM0_9PEZI|nr:hypothetical protein Slin14017_G083630 [Septoria linicola]USW59426.1 hypothetical protein Slin15195_G127450 [Septoria linicola]